MHLFSQNSKLYDVLLAIKTRFSLFNKKYHNAHKKTKKQNKDKNKSVEKHWEHMSFFEQRNYVFEMAL